MINSCEIRPEDKFSESGKIIAISESSLIDRVRKGGRELEKFFSYLLALVASIGESILWILEFFLSHCIWEALRNISRHAVVYIFGAEIDEKSLNVKWRAFDAILLILNSFFVLSWMLYRFSQYFRISFKETLHSMGILKPSLSEYSKIVIAYHVLGFMALILVQNYTSNWYFSLDNYFSYFPQSQDESEIGSISNSKVEYLDIVKLLEMILLSPVKEEILFRGIIFRVVYNRFPSIILPTIVTNAIFGVVHLVNLKNSGYNDTYVILQILLGFEVGVYYTLTLLSNGSLLECIGLHIMNNFFSSFMPINRVKEIHQPFIFIPMLETVCIYALLITRTYNHIASTTKHKKKLVFSLQNLKKVVITNKDR